MLVAEHACPIRAPGRICSIDELRQCQWQLAESRPGPRATQVLPLAGAVGRVLASAPPGVTSGMKSGSRLDWRLLAQLAAGGHTTVEVYEPVRCGVLVLHAASAAKRGPSPAATLLQTLLEQLGAKTLAAHAQGPARCDTPVVRRLARFCDLLLVLDEADAAGSTTAEGLHPPRVLDIEGRPCVLLPADALRALAHFVAFVVPLLRRLQGRCPVLSQIGWAEDQPMPDGPRVEDHLCCVAATATGIRRLAPDAGAFALGDVAGVAWKPADPQALAYLPLKEWLS